MKLKVQVETALAKNIKLNFATPDASSKNTQTHKALIRSLEVRPGDLCCYKIFLPGTNKPKVVTALLAKKMPPFKRRAAIDRDKIKQEGNTANKSR